jgi:PAS domain S-box-containing protein
MKKIRLREEEIELEFKQFHNAVLASCNVVEFSKDAIVTNINDNLLAIWDNADKNLFIGQHYSSFVGDDSYRSVWYNMLKGKHHTDVKTVTATDGKKKPFRHEFIPICDMQGELLRVILLAFPDETEELRQSEEALLQSMEEMATTEEELRQNMEEMLVTQEELRRREAALTETLEELKKTQEENANKDFEIKQFHKTFFDVCNVVELSKDGIVTDINEHLLNIWDNPGKSVFVGKHYSSLVGEDNFKAVWEDMVKGKHHTEIRYVTNATGKTKCFRHDFMPICDKDGELLRVIFLAIPDETEELRNSEAELRRSMEEIASNEEEMRQNMEEMKTIQDELTKSMVNNDFQLTKLNLVVKASKIGLWDMEIVKGNPLNPNNTFLWSDNVRMMLGYSSEADFPNVFRSWSDKLHPDDKERTLDSFAKHMLDRTGKTPFDLECRLLKRNNEYGYFHVFGATLRDSEGYANRVAGALQDITEAKEKSLSSESQLMRLKMIVKASKIALWDMQPVKDDPLNPNNIFIWSDEFNKLLGYSNNVDFPDVLSSWMDKLHPDDKERTLEAFSRHILDRSGKTPYDIEYRLQKKNGEYGYFHSYGAIIRDAEGYPVRIAGAIQDITEAKERAEINEFQLTRLKLIVQASKIALWDMQITEGGDTMNPENSVTWTNEFRKMLGYSNKLEFPDSLNSWSEKLHPDDKDRVIDALTQHLSDSTGKTPFNVQYRLLKRDGEYGYYHAFGATIRNSEGYAVRFAGAIQDITEEKNITESNEYQLTKLGMIVKASNIGLWDIQVVNEDIVNENNVFFWSDEYREMLGYSTEKEFPNIYGSWSDCIHPDDKEKVIEAFKRHIYDQTGETPFDVKYRLRRKSGDYGYFRDYCATIRDAEGCAVRVVGALQDITENIRWETEMRRYHNTIYDACNVIECSIDGFITDINDNFLKLHESEKSEVVDRHMVEFLGEEEYNKVWASLEQRKPYDDVFTMEVTDGKEITFRQKFLPICDNQGNIIRVLLIATPESTLP